MARSKSLTYSTVLVSLLGIAGKGLGFFRSIVVAAAFGAGSDLDAFLVAYTLPTLIPSILAGVMTAVFVPHLVGFLDASQQERPWAGANAFIAFGLLVAVCFGVSAAISSPAVVAQVAPGLTPATLVMAAEMFRVLAPLTVLMAVSAILQAISQVDGKFGLMSLESVITNCAILLSLVLFKSTLGAWCLVYGAAAGVIINCALLVVGNRERIRASLASGLAISHPGFRKLSLDSMPYLVSYGGTWTATLVGQIFVSGLDAGAVAAMSFAVLLAFLPLETVGNAVLTVAYPAVCRAIAANDMVRVRETYARALGVLLLVLLPAAAGLAIAAHPVVRLLFERGAFDAAATARTAEPLAIYTLSVVPRALTFLNFRALVAAGRRWTQIGVGLCGVLAMIIACALLVPRWGLIGAASAALISTMTTLLLSTVFVRGLLRGGSSLIVGEVARALPAAAAFSAGFGIALWLVGPHEGSHWVVAGASLAFAAACGGVLYLVAGHLAGQRDIAKVLARASALVRR